MSAPGISAAYTYDTETGRKTGETVTTAGASAASTYAYTDAGRLSGALTGTTQRVYDFDERGNLKTVTAAGAKTTFAVDRNNDRLLTMSDSAGKTTYVFDALGRRSSQTLSGTTTTYTWDDASRLTSWTRGADSAIYTYDAAGQRTRTVHTQGGKTPVTTTTDYTYDGITLLALSAAQSTTATWTVTYLYDEDGRPYAGVYTSGTAPVTFLIATNDRGDVVGLTNTAGTWFARYTYDPYGRVLAQSAQAVSGITATLASQIATRQVLRYASYAYDAHSATYYLAARHYDPASARFLTEDPARDDGEESAYQYCAGDPVGKVDPTGEAAVAAVLVGAGFVIVVAYVVASPYAASAGTALARVWSNSAGWYKRYLATTLAVFGVVALSVLPRGSTLSATSQWRTPDTHPDDFTRLRGAQGWRHGKSGETWKWDQKHKDHWDVSNSKGQKIREVTRKGKQLWPKGPKNKNK